LDCAETFLLSLVFSLGRPEPGAFAAETFNLTDDASSSLEKSFSSRGLSLRLLLALYLFDPPDDSALDSDMNVLQVSVMQDDVSRTMSAFVTLAGEEFTGATGLLSR
jgi:hypothetical protein